MNEQYFYLPENNYYYLKKNIKNKIREENKKKG